MIFICKRGRPDVNPGCLIAVHADMKSHTSATFMLGKGAISSNSTKQRVNAHSTTESELISVDDKIGK
eukprot:6487565-Ditylum_brightwellii.AAC.1